MSNAYWLLLASNSGKIDKKNPKSGLNPHAGEDGILGSEEQEIILPAIEKARKQGINISDPLPADTIFDRAFKKEFDLVIAMYHDQGLPAFKSLFFENSAQVTLGLPIIRTSVSHGTAYNIAGKNIACEMSLIYALKTAQNLIHRF